MLGNVEDIMNTIRTTLVASAVCAAVAVSVSASAQDVYASGPAEGGPMPTSYTQRPLTLRAGTLRVDAAPSDFGLMDSGMLLGPVGPLGSYGIRAGQGRTHVDPPGLPATTNTDGYGTIGLGASYGITDRVEVGGLLVPLYLNDGADVYGNMALYVRGTLIEGDFSLGLQGTVSLPTRNDLGLGIGVPINVRFGSGIRLETGVEFEMLFDVEDDVGNDNAFVNLDVPLAVSVAIGDGFVGGRTGLTLLDLGDASNAAIPVGAIGGYSLLAGDTLIDLKGGFTWTFLTDDVDYSRSSYWNLLFGANIHFNL